MSAGAVKARAEADRLWSELLLADEALTRAQTRAFDEDNVELVEQAHASYNDAVTAWAEASRAAEAAEAAEATT